MIVVCGAGAFGTGLAIALAKAGRDVVLLGRDADKMAALARSRVNATYLPDAHIPDAVRMGTLGTDLPKADAILLAVPAQTTRAVLGALALPDVPVVFTAKGLETATGLRQSQIAHAVGCQKIASLSGPSFAADLAGDHATAVTLAAEDPALGRHLQSLLSTQSLRLYTSTDLIGVELGGALKNVYAIGCGLSDGAGFGLSARSALLTRSYAEMARLAVAMGAQRETLTGLSGLGDLTLSCTSARSRNYAFGQSFGAASDAPHQTTEGIATARVVTALARHHGVEVPIAAAVVSVLDGTKTPAQAMASLIARPLRPEQDA